MSNAYKYEDVKFRVRTYTSEDGTKIKSISIFVDDEEVVWGADSLEIAIQEFDSNYMEAF